MPLRQRIKRVVVAFLLMVPAGVIGGLLVNVGAPFLAAFVLMFTGVIVPIIFWMFAE